MSEIPQVEDQFAPDAPAEESAAPRFVPTLTGRFPMYVSEQVELDELRRALIDNGFAVIAHAEGWCVDRVHALALVQSDAPPTPLYLPLERNLDAE
jgi:hypothetical protein